MCLETCFAVNLAADLFLIGSVSRALGLFNRRRVLIAGVVCALCALPAAACGGVWSGPGAHLTMLILTCLILTGPAAGRQRATMAFALCAAALIGGGVSYALGLSDVVAALLGSALGGATVCLLFTFRPPETRGYQVEICLVVNGRTSCFTALVDTGNRLREPISGQPVLIAEASLIRDVIPRTGCRELRYGAVGGEGMMACFKPTSVWIRSGARRRRVPDTWIGVAPGLLPGAFGALAPSVYVLYL